MSIIASFPFRILSNQCKNESNNCAICSARRSHKSSNKSSTFAANKPGDTSFYALQSSEQLALAERELHRIVTQFCSTLTMELLQQAGGFECGERSELLGNRIRRDDYELFRRVLSRSEESMSAKGQVLTHIADALSKVNGQPPEGEVREAPGDRAGPSATDNGCDASLPKKVKLDAAVQPDATNRKGSGPGECEVASLTTMSDWLATRVEEGLKWAQNEQSAVLRFCLLHVAYQSKILQGRQTARGRIENIELAQQCNLRFPDTIPSARWIAMCVHASGNSVFMVIESGGCIEMQLPDVLDMGSTTAPRVAHIFTAVRACNARVRTGAPGECGTTNTGSLSRRSDNRFWVRIGCVSAGAPGPAICVLPARVHCWAFTKCIIRGDWVGCENLELPTPDRHSL